MCVTFSITHFAARGHPDRNSGRSAPGPAHPAGSFRAIVLAIILAAAFGGGKEESTTAEPSGSKADATPANALPAPNKVEPADDVAEPAAPENTQPAVTTLPPLTAAPQGKGKTVVYEVISDSPTLSNVTFFDENSEIQQVMSASAPWTRTVQNSSTYVIAGVGAQTEGTSVTCRVTVDGKIKDEQTATGKYAVVNCTAGV